jgi:Rap1a immunity proteins
MNGAGTIRTIALFLALSLSPTVANPQHTIPSGTEDHWGIVTGTVLYSWCSSKIDGGGNEAVANYVEQERCSGYIVGVSDAIGGFLYATKARAVCLPIDATGQRGKQIRDVVVKYLKDHPELRIRLAATLVTEALLDAWDCSK